MNNKLVSFPFPRLLGFLPTLPHFHKIFSQKTLEAAKLMCMHLASLVLYASKSLSIMEILMRLFSLKNSL